MTSSPPLDRTTNRLRRALGRTLNRARSGASSTRRPDGGRRASSPDSPRSRSSTQVMVAPATRTVRGIPTEVVLGREDGMPDDCALNLDDIATVPKGLLTRRITRLGPGKLAELCARSTRRPDADPGEGVARSSRGWTAPEWTTPLATSRCRDVCSSAAGDARTPIVGLDAPARSLPPCGRPLASRFLCHDFDRQDQASRVMGSRDPSAGPGSDPLAIVMSLDSSRACSAGVLREERGCSANRGPDDD